MKPKKTTLWEIFNTPSCVDCLNDIEGDPVICDDGREHCKPCWAEITGEDPNQPKMGRPRMPKHAKKKKITIAIDPNLLSYIDGLNINRSKFFNTLANNWYHSDATEKP